MKWYVEITWADGSQLCHVHVGQIEEAVGWLFDRLHVEQGWKACNVRILPFEQSPVRNVEALRDLPRMD